MHFSSNVEGLGGGDQIFFLLLSSSMRRYSLFKALMDLGIPSKIIKLLQMYLKKNSIELFIGLTLASD